MKGRKKKKEREEEKKKKKGKIKEKETEKQEEKTTMMINMRNSVVVEMCTRGNSFKSLAYKLL